MPTALFVLLFAMAAVAFVIALFFAGTWIGRRIDARSVPVLTEVLLSTRKPDDQAIRGLTDLRARGPVIHLVDARVLDGDAELPAPQLRVERDHVAYIQVL